MTLRTISQRGLSALLALVVVTGDALAASFTLVGVHPDAAAQRTTSGQVIRTLAAWNGKVYAGYGDYDANTGPIAIRAFDPATDTFGPVLVTSSTEAIETFREVSGRLLAPHVDPIAGESSGGYAAGDPVLGTFRDRLVTTAVHLYDMATFDGTDLWLVGSRGNNAAAWRSLDGGGTWPPTATHEQPPRGAATFTRYYFAGLFGGRLYVQSSAYDASQVFDGVAWTDGPDLLPAGALGWHPFEFDGVMAYRSWPYGATRLVGFDGTSTFDALTARVYDVTPWNGNLVALTGEFIPMPGTSAGGRFVRGPLAQGSDWCSWRSVDAAVPDDAVSVTVLDGVVYAGGSAGRLYRLDTALSPLPPALPPLEVEGLRVTRTGADVVLTWRPPLDACTDHWVYRASGTTLREADPFAPIAGGIVPATWTHPGVAWDREFNAYLVHATGPHGDGPLGFGGR